MSAAFTFLTTATSYDSLEFIWINTHLVPISSLFDSLEGNVSRLTIVVGSSSEHLRLNAGLHQTV